jgi:hypothetical protein
MFTTLAKLITNKTFDAAQAQLWTLELFGFFASVRALYTLLLRHVGMDEEEIQDILLGFTVAWQSSHIEGQRQLALTAVDVANKYLANEDVSEATKSFEEALEAFSRSFAEAFPPPSGGDSREVMNVN